MTTLSHWWLTPKFPKIHIETITAYKPEGFRNRLKDLYRSWLVHPIKRRAAKCYLSYLRTLFGLKVIGITGSAGKTSTKEMLAAILRLKGETIYSFANIDPIYNIPTTMLSCKLSTRFLVLEMGVEYPSEMDFYLWLAKPDVGIITNIYPTHIQFFKNVNGVYKEKSKLVKSISKSAFAVLNSADTHLKKIKGKIKAREIWFGTDSQITASNIRFTRDFKTRFTLNIDNTSTKIKLPVLGKQFIENALAAVSAAKALGIDIKKIKRGLESFKNQEHRMTIKKLKVGAILIDDSYNNNPEAAKKAIQMLSEVSGKRKNMLVFGDMLELGKDEVKLHKEMGKYIRANKIDYVVGVGSLSKYIVSNTSYLAEDWKDAIPLVRKLIKKDMVILVKGSRSIGLENLVSALK